MPVLFKDFDEEVEDFFEEYLIAGSKGFKLENKSKGADRTLYVNPNYEDNVLTVNFQYDVKEKGLKTKLGLGSNGTVVPKVTYEGNGQKLELKDTFKLLNCCDWSGELVHEMKSGIFSLYSKSKFGASAKYTSDVSASVGLTDAISVGAGASVDLVSRGISNIKAGLRFTQGSTILSGSFEPASAAIGVNLLTTVKGVFCGKNVDLAGQFSNGAINFGLQTTCPFTGATVRATSGLAGQYGLVLIKALPGNLTVSGGVDGSIFNLACPMDKLAVTVTRE